jgi:hypothetical protein
MKTFQPITQKETVLNASCDANFNKAPFSLPRANSTKLTRPQSFLQTYKSLHKDVNSQLSNSKWKQSRWSKKQVSTEHVFHSQGPIPLNLQGLNPSYKPSDVAWEPSWPAAVVSNSQLCKLPNECKSEPLIDIQLFNHMYIHM